MMDYNLTSKRNVLAHIRQATRPTAVFMVPGECNQYRILSADTVRTQHDIRAGHDAFGHEYLTTFAPRTPDATVADILDTAQAKNMAMATVSAW